MNVKLIDSERCPLKILYLTNLPTPYRVNFFNELGKNCDLTVLFEQRYANNRDKSWLNNSAVSYREVDLPGINIGNDTAMCVSIIKYLRDNTYDLIIIGGYATPTGMIAIEYLKMNKIKFALNTDGGIIKNDSKMKFFTKKHFIGAASYWLSTSSNTDKYLEQYGAKKNRIYRYPFSSLKNEDILQDPITSRQKEIIREKLNIKENKVIISVGQFIYRKGFDLLIEASKYLDKDTGIYIIGGIPTEEFISNKEEYGLTNVHYIGYKNKEELTEYYKAADLFVLPTREDIWGLVINEAMGNGLPIITTENCVAGLELVENGKNGYIIPVDNFEQIVEKANMILKNVELHRNMSIASLETIRDFSIESMAEAHIEIFNEIIGENK